MTTRRIAAEELPELLRLYAFLHPEDPVVDPHSGSVQHMWSQILRDPNLHYYVVEEQQQLVSTCTLTVIPNLTRDVRPYGLIENVITDPLSEREDLRLGFFALP
jgi:hypothetical protein